MERKRREDFEKKQQDDATREEPDCFFPAWIGQIYLAAQHCTLKIIMGPKNRVFALA